ncbi:cell division control 48 protein, putative [Babesia ovis]|uniref:Cell division control 48 protein, putative n=1 Tax=Babesia ovis TaxID=5869 RepID=A0A9W5TE93_BABOV|nr:cell division control 48 protein, putative [Babesia ovis]
MPTLSLASWRSSELTKLRPLRTQVSAASLTRFFKSAPEYPGVSLAKALISTSSLSYLIFSRYLLRIASRPSSDGSGMCTTLSKRPGLSRALSRASRRLVAANRVIPVDRLKPSISTSNWLSVWSCSLFWLLMEPEARLAPMASISSINTIQGACFLALAKRLRTLWAPWPTNISTNSGPLVYIKGILASVATALASMVLPVPGGPTRSTPFGILAPISWYNLGCLINLTTSISSSLASSIPMTSLKNTRSSITGGRDDGEGGGAGALLSLSPLSLGVTWPKSPSLGSISPLSAVMIRPVSIIPAAIPSTCSSNHCPTDNIVDSELYDQDHRLPQSEGNLTLSVFMGEFPDITTEGVSGGIAPERVFLNRCHLLISPVPILAAKLVVLPASVIGDAGSCVISDPRPYGSLGLALLRAEAKKGLDIDELSWSSSKSPFCSSKVASA